MNPTTSTLLSPETKASQEKIEFGLVTTVSAADVIQTKLKNVRYVVVTAQDDPILAASKYTAVPGSNGTFTLKGWKATASGDATPVAASTFTKKVSYMAVGE